MSRNTLWTVTPPDGEDMTFIAPSPEEAKRLAAEYCDDTDEDGLQYEAEPAEGGEHWTRSSFRYIGLDSLSDAEAMVSELENAGVSIAHIRMRVTYRGRLRTGSPQVILYEVGTRDGFWCQLEPGYLCGGDQ